MVEPRCEGHKCTETKLIDAHIIPKAIGRFIRRGSTGNTQISASKIKAAQLGIYDKEILCERCDGILGKYDKVGIEFFRSAEQEVVAVDKIRFEVPSAHIGDLAKFLLSILWRASISKRPEVQGVRLGSYTARISEILFGVSALETLKKFDFMVHRYVGKSVDPELVYFLPIR